MICALIMLLIVVKWFLWRRNTFFFFFLRSAIYKSSSSFRCNAAGTRSWLTIDLRTAYEKKKQDNIWTIFADLLRELNKFTITPPQRFSISPIARKKSIKGRSRPQKTTSLATHLTHVFLLNSRFSELVKSMNFVCSRQIRSGDRLEIQYLDAEQLITLIPRREDEWTSHGKKRRDAHRVRYRANKASCASEITNERDEEKRSRTKRRQNVRPNEDWLGACGPLSRHQLDGI